MSRVHTRFGFAHVELMVRTVAVRGVVVGRPRKDISTSIVVLYQEWSELGGAMPVGLGLGLGLRVRVRGKG